MTDNAHKSSYVNGELGSKPRTKALKLFISNKGHKEKKNYYNMFGNRSLNFKQNKSRGKGIGCKMTVTILNSFS